MKLTAPCFFSFLLCLAFTSESLAHDPGLSTVRVCIEPKKTTVELVLSFRDAALLADFDPDRDGKTGATELTAAEEMLIEKAVDAFALKWNGDSAALNVDSLTTTERDNVTIQLSAQALSKTAFSFQSFWLAELPRGHRQFVAVYDVNQKPIVEQLLSGSENTITFQLSANSEDRTGFVNTKRKLISANAGVLLGAAFILPLLYWAKRRFAR